MTTGLLVTITQPAQNKLGQTQRSEVAEYAYMLEALITRLVTTQQTSGTITDRNGGGNLVYTYTPIASQ